MIELLRTYVFIPRPRKDLFARPRFVDSLNAVPVQSSVLSERTQIGLLCVAWSSRDNIERESYMASDNPAFSGAR
jgi:hypothetical protein